MKQLRETRGALQSTRGILESVRPGLLSTAPGANMFPTIDEANAADAKQQRRGTASIRTGAPRERRPGSSSLDTSAALQAGVTASRRMRSPHRSGDLNSSGNFSNTGELVKQNV